MPIISSSRTLSLFPGLLALLLATPAAASVYEAPFPEPTAEEVAILELMNRYRADPPAAGQRILDASDLPSFFWKNVDKDMFKREMDVIPPAPPLVFDLNALRAAREHSHYMILNGVLTHVQDPSKPGFTGRSFSDRMKAADFNGSPGAENAFRDAGNAWQSHAGFIIDFGAGGEGGMQKGRGHRMNMVNPRFNVVGPSAVPHGNRFSVTHKLGSVRGRFVGGAIYVDRNRNGIFDPGEQRAGVTITLADGSAETRTWDSGGYVLKLPNQSAHTLVIRAGQLTNTIPIPAGKENVHISWAVPPEEELAAADRMIAEVSAIDDDQRNATRRRRALIALHMGALTLDLDHKRRSTVDSLTADVVAELHDHQRRYLQAINDDDRRALNAIQREASSAWRGTAAAPWFEEAAILAKAQNGVNGYHKAKESGRTIDERLLKQLRDSLREAREASNFTDLRAAYADLLQAVSGDS